MDLSDKTIERICRVFGYLDVLEKRGVDFISSRDLALGVGATEYTIRKDISLLNITSYTRKGYKVEHLKKELGKRLHLDQKRKACIVGLGRLGAALLDYERFKEDGFEIVAGFDCLPFTFIELTKTNRLTPTFAACFAKFNVPSTFVSRYNDKASFPVSFIKCTRAAVCTRQSIPSSTDAQSASAVRSGPSAI